LAEFAQDFSELTNIPNHPAPVAPGHAAPAQPLPAEPLTAHLGNPAPVEKPGCVPDM